MKLVGGRQPVGTCGPHSSVSFVTRAACVGCIDMRTK